MREDLKKAFHALGAPEDEHAPAAEPTVEEFVGFIRTAMSTYGGTDVAKATAGVHVQPVDADGVPCAYVYPPNAAQDRRIVYLHGGAWIGGGMDSHLAMAAHLARHAGCPVLLVEYRMAPEHPFPAPLEDSEKAFRWCLVNGVNGPETVADVALGGDSSGANLAAAVCVKAIRESLPIPSRLALVSPFIDIGWMGYTPRHDPVTVEAARKLSASLYAPDHAADMSYSSNALISPMQAEDDVLEKFPPTFLQASTDEYFADEARRFAARLSLAGKRTILSMWPEMPHVWHAALDLIPEADAAIKELAGFLKE